MWYEERDQYTDESPLSENDWGDKLGLVSVYEKKTPDGDDTIVTTSGWGQTTFERTYASGKFNPRGYLRRYKAGRAFGLIMRTVPLLCVDIDGKNGGLGTARILKLPPTLAERSKSGNGFHLFYRVPGEWSDEDGFDTYGDFNGIVPGVDVRGTGIVYHYPGQRWNNLPVADLSLGMTRLLDSKQQSRVVRMEATRKRRDMSDEDRMDEIIDLEEQLARRITTGRRNEWLYAWGCRAIGVHPKWSELLIARGTDVGLPQFELMSIVNNVAKYGTGDAA